MVGCVCALPNKRCTDYEVDTPAKEPEPELPQPKRPWLQFPRDSDDEVEVEVAPPTAPERCV